MAQAPLSSVVRHLRRAAHLAESTSQTDGDLLNRYLLDRNDVAFESLLKRHGAMVLGVCRRILRNEADAQDAFQATFLVFVRKAASIQPRGLVANWLYGVAQKTSLKARVMNRRREANARLRKPAFRDASHDQAQMELADLLDQELSRLPAKYRAPVVLCELEGRSLKEAAQQLACPEGTVASRLARGRNLLAKRLAGQGLALSGAALAPALAREAMAATVPSALFASTARSASAFVAGPALAAGVVSSKVFTLAEGVLRTMFLSKLKLLTAVFTTVALAGGGGSLATYQASGPEQKVPRLQAASSAAEHAQEQPKPDKQKDDKPKSEERTHGYLGVMLKGDEEGGPVLVHEVFPDSPAAKAGVKAEDIVLKVGKTDVKDPQTAVGILKTLKPGEKVTIRFKRDDKQMDVTITLAKWPVDFQEGGKPEKSPAQAAEKARGFLGLKMREHEDNSPVVIHDTEPDSPAAKAGIMAEDIVLKVGKDEVKSPEELIKQLRNLKEGDKVTLRIKRGDKEMDVTLTAAKRPPDFGKM
jgi:RNA polymerase sigma factor (sigma-70 family)